MKGVTLTKRGDYQLQVYDKKTQQMKYVKRTQDADEIAKIINKKTEKNKRPRAAHRKDLTRNCTPRRP